VKPVPFDYMCPASVDEAVEALGRHGDDAKVLAGGQSLVPLLNLRLVRPGVLVDINRITAFDYLREGQGFLAVGALCRQRGLERWASGRVPLLAAALAAVSHLAIRTRATIAGSLAHADPAAELPALLLALDGAVVVRGTTGERVIAAPDLFRGPLTTTVGAGELITEVRFALPPAGTGWGFAEVTRRHGDFALVGAVALLGRSSGGAVETARLAFFGVGDTAVRSTGAEAALVGREPTVARFREVARVAAEALSPDTDLHATAAYRRRVAAVLAERTLVAALRRTEAAGPGERPA
jgi:aerobic carbon-monoxide dehydrogenase medium subunit